MIINLILYLGGQHGSVLLIVAYEGSKRHTLSCNLFVDDV